MRVADKVWADAVYKHRELDVCRWVSQHMRPVDSDYGRRVVLDSTPWLKPILASYNDPNVERIVVQSASQCGKTLSLLSLMAYAISEDPSNMLVVLDTEKAMKDFSKNKMNKHLELCQPVAKLLPRTGYGKGADGRTMSHIDFGNFWVMVKPANESALRSHTCKRIFGDECSKWPVGQMENAIARTSGFRNKKIMLTSTPLLADEGMLGSDFERAWEEGSREIWGLQCQNCGELVPCRFKFGDKYIIVWNHKKAKRGELDWDYDVVRETARLKCHICGHKHRNEPRTVKKMNDGGAYIQFNDKPRPGVKSFRFNKIALQPALSKWGDLAVDFLESKKSWYVGDKEALQKFFNLSIGESFHINYGDDDDVLTTPEIDVSLEKGTVITAGIDVQLNHYWIAIREWQKDGKSVLRHFSRCETEAQLKHVLESCGAYHKDPRHPRNKGVGIDIAFERDQHLAMASRNGWLGMAGSQSQHTWIKYLHEIMRTDGSVAEKVWMIFSPVKSGAIGTKLNRGRAYFVDFNSRDAGIWTCRLRDRKPDLPDWIVPDSALGEFKEEYVRQIKSVRIVPERDRRGLVTNTLYTGKNDHAMDCEKMCLIQALRAGANLVNMGRVSEREVRRQMPSPVSSERKQELVIA